MSQTTLQSFDRPIDVMVQGASRGIGAAFVAALASSPSVRHVVATSRNPDDSEALAAVRRDIGDRLVTGASVALDGIEPDHDWSAGPANS